MEFKVIKSEEEISRESRLIDTKFLWILDEEKEKEIIQFKADKISKPSFFSLESVSDRDVHARYNILPQFYKNIDIWKKIVSKLISNSHAKILLDPFVETSFEIDSPYIPYVFPWRGILHYGFDNDYRNVQSLFQNKLFLCSLYSCKGLFVLSNNSKNKLEEILKNLGFEIPVRSIYHPYPFLPYKFEYRPKYLLHVGKFYRDLSKFENFSTKLVKKIHSKHLNYSDYISLLHRSVIFIYLIDCSACVTVIEAIMHNIPIIVNRLPSVEEYLGKEYPLYYSENMKLTDLKINKARMYLSKIDKQKFHIGNFIDKLFLYEPEPEPEDEYTDQFMSKLLFFEHKPGLEDEYTDQLKENLVVFEH